MQSIEEKGEERRANLDAPEVKRPAPNACMDGFSVAGEVRKLMQVMEEKPKEGEVRPEVWTEKRRGL